MEHDEKLHFLKKMENIMCIKKISIGAIVLFVSQSVGATQIYQCKDNHGQTVFSQMPCGKNAEKITVETVSPTRDQIKSTQETNARNDAMVEHAEKQRGLQSAKDRVQELIKERDGKLQALRYKKLYAANNLAGATWEKSISDEMAAVTTRYNADIDAARQHVRDLEKQN